MKLKYIAAAAALSLIFTIGAAAKTCESCTAQNDSAVNAEKFNGQRKRAEFCNFGMRSLSKITGLTEEQLTEKYPQKTVWQIAYQLGKLDELKKSVLEEHTEIIGKLLQEKRISESDAVKMTEDIKKRINAIDGKNTVILGKPGYMPKIQKNVDSAG